MAKSFLRSGSLDDFLALGENGQPLYACAAQLREALRLRQYPAIADCLAIPQLNESGTRIDWYAPSEGKITSWNSATLEEQTKALTLLEQHLTTLHTLSQQSQTSLKPAQRLFGLLLEKTLQFPSAQHVYLVEGNPVITFWGFISKNQKPRLDPLSCLQPVADDDIRVTIPHRLTESAEPSTTHDTIDQETASITATVPTEAEANSIVETAAVSAEHQEQTVSNSSPLRRKRYQQIGGLLLLSALLVFLTLQIRGCSSEKSSLIPPTAVKSEKRVLDLPDTVKPSAVEIASTPEKMTSKSTLGFILPLHKASVIAPPEPLPTEIKPTTELPPAASVATTTPSKSVKGALIMPSEAVKHGSSRFLDGKWRVTVEMKTPLTGKPPSMLYQFKGGKGSAQITHGDNIVCKSNVTAGLMKSGNLVINSRIKARCSDGSRYQLPEIVCKQGAAEVAECQGRYDAETVFPMTIKRESK